MNSPTAKKDMPSEHEATPLSSRKDICLALFGDNSATVELAKKTGGPAGRYPFSRRRRAGLSTLFAALGLAVVMAFIPAPYVVERPGPVYNTLGSSAHDGVETPLISIVDAPSFATNGSLDLMTVTVFGNREHRASWFTIALAWFDPSAAVVPIDAVFPAGVTQSDREERNQVLMVNSQNDAVAAALVHLGYRVPEYLSVVSIGTESPAAGILEPKDRIIALNNNPVANVEEFRAGLAAVGAGNPATITIVRNGSESDVVATPIDKDGATVLAVGVGVDYDFPVTVTIQLDNVGGPSAGMMFALGIIDKMTPGDANGGKKIAGTGTINAAGEVGAIGGIRQKMFAARNAGDLWFLAPASNCKDVAGHIPDGLTVLAVSTLNDATFALGAIATDGDTRSLPTCDAAST